MKGDSEVCLKSLRLLWTGRTLFLPSWSYSLLGIGSTTRIRVAKKHNKQNNNKNAYTRTGAFRLGVDPLDIHSQALTFCIGQPLLLEPSPAASREASWEEGFNVEADADIDLGIRRPRHFSDLDILEGRCY